MKAGLTLRIAERVLRVVLPAEMASAIVGDLEEDARAGPRRLIRTWIAVQVAGHVAAAIGLPHSLVSRGARAARHAFRPWRRQPAVALVSIATLAVAFGAQSAFFSVADALSLKPLPIDRPDQLVAIRLHNLRGPVSVTAPVFDEIVRRRPVLTSLAGYLGARMTTTVGGAIVQEPVAFVSADFFKVMKARVVIGRVFTLGDFGPTAATTAHVVVLGERFWRSAFNADPSVVGQHLQVEGVTLDVIGVVPDEQTGLQLEAFNAVVLPASVLPELTGDGTTSASFHYQALIGRLRDHDEISAVRAQLVAQWPGVDAAAAAREPQPTSHRELTVDSAETGFSFLRPRYEGTLRLLTALASLMVIVACLGVGGLMVAATLARVPELRLRMALGATRWDVLAQLVAEATAICGLGATIGFAAGSLAARPLLTRLWADVNLRDVNLSLDWRLTAVAAGSALIAVVGASIAPALLASRSLRTAATPGTVRTTTARRGMTHHAALVGQLTLTLVLVMAAGVFVRTLEAERPDDSHLESDRVFSAMLSSGFAHAGASQNATIYYETLVRTLLALPGVESVALTHAGPFMGLPTYRLIQVSDAVGSSDTSGQIDCAMDFVGAGFFDTIGLPLEGGHDFMPGAQRGAASVILSSVAAHALFGHTAPIGRRVRLGVGASAREASIIGVAQDSRYQDIRVSHPLVVYLQPESISEAEEWGRVVLRARTPSSIGQDEVNRAVMSLGQERVANFGSFADIEDSGLLKERLAASIGLFFAVLSCALGAVGVYARTAQIVEQRRREFGVRLALGALAGRLRLDVVRGGALAGATASLVGVPLGVLLLRVARSQLFGLRAADPALIAFTVGVLLVVVILASYWPTRAIANSDAMEALRGD